MEKYTFEELKMVYESAEKVTDRRLALNKTNYSICVAVFAADALIWKWTTGNSHYLFPGLLLVGMLSGMAFKFCSHWIAQIKDFKSLNTAKFEVINEMAKNIYFNNPDELYFIKSFEPFSKEWQILKRLEALQSSGVTESKALKSTRKEFFLPQAFQILFIVILSIAVLSIAINPSKTWEGIKFLLQTN